MLGVITIDVLPGLVIGVVSMLLLVVYYASRPHVGVLGRIPGAPGAYGDVGRHPQYESVPGLLVLRLESPLFYANATLVRDRVKHAVGAAEPLPRAVVVDVGANPSLDITSSEMLEQLVDSLHGVGIDFALVEVRRPVADMLRRSGVLATMGEGRVFHTIDEAVASLARDRAGTDESAKLPPSKGRNPRRRSER
jgi:MFS superfamily sulfate permease-like transporter